MRRASGQSPRQTCSSPSAKQQRRLGERKELLSVPTFQPLTADRLWMLEFGESWTVD
jgi:hypothetical protein